MSTKSPLEQLAFFFDAINRKDLDAVMSCYEPTAVLSQRPAAGNASGAAQIREAVAGFLAFHMEALETRELIDSAGGIALTGVTWKATGHGPDGKPLELSGKSTEVFRRQPSGEWKLAIDSPWWVA